MKKIVKKSYVNECPICGRDLSDLSEHLDTTLKNGNYVHMLVCGRCNFKRILDIESEEDVVEAFNEYLEWCNH